MFKNFLLSLFSLLFSFVFAEGCLQVSCAQGSFCASKYMFTKSSGENIYSNESVHHLVANKSEIITTYDYSVQYNTNSIGVRGTEDEINNSVVVLGDSQTFGEGVEFPEIFSQNLDDDNKYINFGIPGYGLGQIFHHYKAKVNKIKNQKGSILFFLHTLYYRNHLNENSKELYQNHDYFHNSISSQKENSTKEFEIYYFYQYVRIWWGQREQLKLESVKRWEKKNTNTESIISPEIESEKELRFTNYLTKIRNIKKELPFCVVNISTYKFKFLENLQSELNFKYIDISDELVEYSKTYPLRFEYDRHYNANTHKFIAETLKNQLIECSN